jgi:AcrR family transcriptional regulator
MADRNRRTRGRPKDATRREGVLDATRELLVAKGYDEITLAEVARLAGVSRPFMYDNWGNKFALVEDAIFTATDQTQLIDEHKPFAEALTDLIAAMVAIQSDPAYLAGLPGLSAELYNRPDLVNLVESKYIAPVRAVYVRLVERGKAEGIVRDDVDGSALLDTIRGAVMLHTLINPSLKHTALIEHLRSIILNGITVGR